MHGCTHTVITNIKNGKTLACLVKKKEKYKISELCSSEVFPIKGHCQSTRKGLLKTRRRKSSLEHNGIWGALAIGKSYQCCLNCAVNKEDVLIGTWPYGLRKNLELASGRISFKREGRSNDRDNILHAWISILVLEVWVRVLSFPACKAGVVCIIVQHLLERKGILLSSHKKKKSGAIMGNSGDSGGHLTKSMD